MATCLPPSINKQKVIEDLDKEESEDERSEVISVDLDVDQDSSCQKTRTWNGHKLSDAIHSNHVSLFIEPIACCFVIGNI